MATERCADCGRWLTQDESRPCPRCGGTARNSGGDQTIADEKAEVARELAKKHYEAEAGLQRIFRLAGSAEAEALPMEPIKLLEVNSLAVPSGVLPVSFGPAPSSGIWYPSVIVEVSPEEFTRIQSHQLSLPRGWLLGEELFRPNDEMELR